MLDHAVVRRLLDAEASDDLRARIDTAINDEFNVAGQLRHWSVRGDLEAVRSAAAGMRLRAEMMGLRRLANRLVELERVANLETIGQAHLQSQHLARLIDEEIVDDFQALKDAIDEVAA